jgi:hypothetical protein
LLLDAVVVGVPDSFHTDALLLVKVNPGGRVGVE